jgi:thiosulfate dehydrogenase [quinone] large subunit
MTATTAWPGARGAVAPDAGRRAIPVTALSGRQGLALVRLGLGLLFLVSAWDKTVKGWLATGEPLAQTLGAALPKAEAFYRPFLEGTVLPQAGLFARLVTLGEWAAGLSLALGLLTRLGALSAVWLLLNYLAMKGALTGQWLTPTAGSDRLYVLGALVCCLAAAGLTWGLDGRLRGVVARVPLASWLAGVRAVPRPAPGRPRRRVSGGRGAPRRPGVAGGLAA